MIHLERFLFKLVLRVSIDYLQKTYFKNTRSRHSSTAPHLPLLTLREERYF